MSLRTLLYKSLISEIDILNKDDDDDDDDDDYYYY